MNKKMYYIANARIPTQRAHGLQIMKMCEAFANNGVEVELVLPNRFNELEDSPFEYYNVQQNFSITKLFTIDIAPHREPAHPFFYWLQSLSFALSAWLYMFFKKDAFIYYRFDKALLMAFSLLRSRNITCESHFLIKGWQQKFLLRSTNVIVVNKTTKKIYDTNTDFEEKVLVAPDGVSLSDFKNVPDRSHARALLNLQQDKKLVVYTGYFYKWKGVDILLRAAKLLPPNVHVVLVGGSEADTEPMLSLAKKLGIENISFINFKPYREIQLYQKAADCLVVTGSALYEESSLFTSPLKLFEYMASGNPIVASRTNAIEEILKPDINAMLVEPDNPEALADGIKKVLFDTNFVDVIANNAKRDVIQYDWYKRADCIISFIKNRALQPRVLYLFAGERRWMVDLWRKKKFADSQLIGINHIHNNGINAQFLETSTMNRLRKINFNLAQLPALRKLRNYDVVFLGSNLLFVFLVKKILRFKKPKIVFYNTFFTNALRRNKSGLYARIIRSAISSIDIIVCPSTSQKKFLEDEGFDSKKIVFIPNGVDAEFFRPTKKSEDEFSGYILSMGKDMGRDYKTLIDAVDGLDIKVRIAASRRNIENIGAIPSNVDVLYDVPQYETTKLYSDAAFVVVPTFKESHLDASDCSGQYVLLEAMASGRAVIASARSTLTDYFCNDREGIVILPEDSNDLKNAILHLSKSKVDVQRFELQSRRVVEERFNTIALAQSLSEVFKKALM